jgi:cell division GTPase FtsZ
VHSTAAPLDTADIRLLVPSVLSQGISDMIMTPGQVNIDMADIQSVMRNAGTAMMGTGSAAGAPGSDRAVQAARQAVQAPLLLQSVSHATGGGSSQALVLTTIHFAMWDIVP